MDLPEFVTARLDDAEAALTALPAAARGRWEASDNLIGTRQWVGLFAAPAKPGGPAPDLGRIADRAVAEHAARYGPAWVAADIAAKRAIVAAYVQAKAEFDRAAPRAGDVTAFDGGILTGHMVGLREAVAMLAAADAARPDYKPEWRIGA